MNDLIQTIVNKTGLSQEKAVQVANTVIGYLKSKLPASIGGQLDGLLAGGGTEGQGEGLAEKAKSMVAGLGGLLGKKEE